MQEGRLRPQWRRAWLLGPPENPKFLQNLKAYETLLFDPRILWPDTLSLAKSGYMYLLNNQLHRQPSYHFGRERRQPPYTLLRFRVDATPVRLE